MKWQVSDACPKPIYIALCRLQFMQNLCRLLCKNHSAF